MTTEVPADCVAHWRLFAVIPAAGHSRRMGRPKLLLPVGGQTVIARLLAALAHPAIIARVVVHRRDDIALRDEVSRAGASAISPDVDPPDMRASVEFGLKWIEETWHPQPDDGWLMLPGDHPQLDQQTVRDLAEAWRVRRPRLLLPTFEGRRGHPLIARWDTVAAVRSLPAESGLNQLLKIYADELQTLTVKHAGVVTDLDAPADYERLRSAGPGAASA